MAVDFNHSAALRDDLQRFIKELVATHQGNRDKAGYRYFDAPLVGFASAADDLFNRYKRIIGPFHWTPSEALQHGNGQQGITAGTVICWVLPIIGSTRASNARQEKEPSLQWARTRQFGERFNDLVRSEVVNFIRSSGGHAAAPMLSEKWSRIQNPETGLASTWSERHAAYAAGLGTFSLSDGFITPVGIAHRCGSVITDIRMEPSRRLYRDYRENCLACSGLECGTCIDRCPCGAISLKGHDKDKCDLYYRCDLETVCKEYGLSITGCGLCQTGVPCESSIP
jgi:epoxyqueuosine reductase QueG